MLLRSITQRNKKTSGEQLQELLTVPRYGSGQLHEPATMPPGKVRRQPFDRRLGECRAVLTLSAPTASQTQTPRLSCRSLSRHR